MSYIAQDEDVLVGGFLLRNLSRCFNESFAIPFDVLLEVSDGHKVQELRAHRFVLALHSDVLEVIPDEEQRTPGGSQAEAADRVQYWGLGVHLHRN